MSEPEAIGEAVSGAVVARALGPGAGEIGTDGYSHELACLNCGTRLKGDFCAACGQRAHVHRTLGAFVHDLLHGVLHLDGKVWLTLPMLVAKPGELTRRYIDGERAKFVSPMALFLFSVFLMFVVFTTVGGPFDIQSSTSTQAQQVRADRGQALAKIEALEAERRSRAAAGQPTTEIDIELRIARNALALADRLGTQGPETAVVAAGQTERGTRGRLTIGRTGVEAIDRALAKAAANPDLLLYKLQNNAYKFSWLLIPLSVPLVWALFLHRRRYRQFRAYDHTVFVTYSIAFMTLGLVALTFLRLIGATEAMIGLAIFLVPPVHIYRQLRGGYSLSRWSALWRTAVLLLFATVSAALFLGLLTLIGVLA